MRSLKIYMVTAIVVTITACSVFKKSKPTPPPPTPPEPPVASTPVRPGLPRAPKSKDGIFAPGNDELVAIQAHYKDATMQTLADGYAIYTGVCTNCHASKSIYSRPELAWPEIIESMAREAKLTGVQKDAVYKYVMSIKGTQGK